MRGIKAPDLAKIVCCLIVFVFIALVFSQADKKFVLDELDFPIVAHATSETGLPVYYRGEATPQHLGLYHPPLYIYALALHTKIFGFSENSVRSFGLLCTLSTALLAILIGKRLRKEEGFSLFAPIFCALYLLNPYTIANTTLPDIDQTVLPFLLTLFIFFLFNKESSKRLLAGAFGLLLWAKLTTPLALIPFAFVYWIIAGESKKSALQRAFVVFGGGAALFVATYWIYCTATNLPFRYTFEFLLQSFAKGGNSSGIGAFFSRIAQNFSYSVNLISWATVPFSLLFVACIAYFSRKPSNGVERQKILFLAFFFLFIAVFYCGLISPFGGFFKYPFPAFQFAGIGIALMVAEKMELPGHSLKLNVLLIFAFALIAAVVQATFFADRPDMGTRLSIEKLALGALALGLLLGLALVPRQRGGRQILYGALSVATGLAIGVGLGISRYQAVAPFPTKYYYGQQGMDEAASYLKEQLRPGEPIWGMKDIGFYSGNHYFESYVYFFEADGGKKLIDLSKSKVRFFVATKGIGEDRIDAYPKIKAALEECCLLAKNFGNYYIYKARR